MMRSIAVLALLLTGVVSAHAAPAPSANSTAFAQTFARDCFAERTDYKALNAFVAADGWVGANADQKLQTMLDQTRRIQDKVKGLGGELNYEAYSRTDGDHHYYLVVTAGTVPGQPATLACYLYDMDEGAPIDPAAVEAAIGVTDHEHHDDKGGSFDLWALDGVPRRVFLGFIPPASEVAGLAGYTGVALIINTSAVPS
jgi:hypothetical protein